ncbi:MAG: hypothetical protein H6704_01710 [Myxococcales bacterium]|nr:hypothetical protein [Myxococcales bacterium]
MRPRLLLPMILGLAASACGPAEPDKSKFHTAASCESDDDCAKGFICKEKTCQKGERTAAELAAMKKAKDEAKQKARAEAVKKKQTTKPGEGRLTVRICPVYKNTIESIGTVVAKNTETKKEHLMHLAREIPEGDWADEFTFWSLPPGTYEVTASYGISKNGIADTVQLKCDDKHIKDKKACKDDVVRIMEVVPLDKMAPPEKDKDGNPIKKPCDWQAE